MESLASLYNNEYGEEVRMKSQIKDHKNSQLSNALATKSLKLKSIKCGAELALEALEILYLMCNNLK
jgi:hypothetical protein